jgi:hypothetical protein
MRQDFATADEQVMEACRENAAWRGLPLLVAVLLGRPRRGGAKLAAMIHSLLEGAQSRLWLAAAWASWAWA